MKVGADFKYDSFSLVLSAPHWLSDSEIDDLDVADTYADHNPPWNGKVIRHGKSWYFWSDDGKKCYGPFFTQGGAKDEYRKYKNYVGM